MKCPVNSGSYNFNQYCTISCGKKISDGGFFRNFSSSNALKVAIKFQKLAKI